MAEVFTLDNWDDSYKSVYQRVGHVTVPYKHYILVWGGFKSGFQGTEVYCSAGKIWSYDKLAELWTLKITKGAIPFPNSGCTGIVLKDYLYVFGGVEELTFDLWRYGCELHILDLKTLTWTTPTTTGVSPKGGDKSIGWAHDNKIYFFGGYGQYSRTVHQNYTFIGDPSNHLDRGWNNQLSIFDPATSHWTTPKTGGTPPGPRAAHAFDKCGDKVYIFGGRLVEGRSNDMHILDLKTMNWTQMKVKDSILKIPEGRSWHSFNFISEKRALLFGGLNRQEGPCGDLWECEIENNQVSWRLKGTVPKDQTLVWHRAVVSKETEELILIGGVTCSPYVMTEENHVDKLHVIPFGPGSLLRLTLQVIVESDIILNLLKDKKSYLPKCLMDLVLAKQKIQNEISIIKQINLISPS